MTTSPRIRPDGSQDAVRATPQATVGEPQDAARKGVRTALRSGPRQGDGRRPVAWLHITAPPDWTVTPTGHSWCACGRDRSAVGRRRVLDLIAAHTAHRSACPLRASQEGRDAA